MTASMTPAAWQQLEQLARQHGLSDAQLAGLAIGCPRHGNASMDFDDDGVFCHRCDRAATAARELAAHEAHVAAIGGRCSHGGHDWEGTCSDIDDALTAVPCEACGAEPGEPCRPMCTGQAAHEDDQTVTR